MLINRMREWVTFVSILLLIGAAILYIKCSGLPFRELEDIIKVQRIDRFEIDIHPTISGPYKYVHGAAYSPGQPIEGVLDNFKINLGIDSTRSTLVLFLRNPKGETDYAVLKSSKLQKCCNRQE